VKILILISAMILAGATAYMVTDAVGSIGMVFAVLIGLFFGIVAYVLGEQFDD